MAVCFPGVPAPVANAWEAHHAAPKQRHKPSPEKAKKETGVHGNSWAFGQSADRDAALWNRGVRGKNIRANAVPKVAKKAAVDTARGIDAAISNVEKKSRSPIGVKLKNETTEWKVAPVQKDWHQDEAIARDGRHVLGAYAGMRPLEDLDINVGPELILKDDQNVRENSNRSQPDSVLGLGMNFKLGF